MLQCRLQEYKTDVNTELCMTTDTTVSLITAKPLATVAVYVARSLKHHSHYYTCTFNVI